MFLCFLDFIHHHLHFLPAIPVLKLGSQCSIEHLTRNALKPGISDNLTHLISYTKQFSDADDSVTHYSVISVLKNGQRIGFQRAELEKTAQKKPPDREISVLY